MSVETKKTSYLGYVEYDDEVLHRIQNIELEMLHDFIDLCDRHNLRYFGMDGTAIGAMRHSGFVPWDDDIDIGMPRKDFNRFAKLAQEELGERYRVLTPLTEPDFPYIPMHLSKRGTCFAEKNFKDKKCELGIFLDIYPFDDTYPDPLRRGMHAWRTWFWGKLFVLRHAPQPVIYMDGAAAKLVLSACRVGNAAMRFLGIDPVSLYKNMLRCSTECSRKNVKTEYFAYFCAPSPFVSILRKRDIFPLSHMSFEGIDMCFPHNTDKLLRKRYSGDYMQLPPPEKRHNHPPYKLELGD